jgi:hypothetical protein
LQWVIRLRDDLGGDYRVSQSTNMILLSALDSDDTHHTINFAERALTAIREQLKHVAWTGSYGKHVLLLFMDDDDYYQYYAHYWRDGIHPASGGVMIAKGYAHMAMPYHGKFVMRESLAHELSHNCLAHLRLPLWLNEGVAVRLQKFVASQPRPILDRELAALHRSHWTETNIQAFWAGTSFQEVSDVRKLSYSLSEILVHLLCNEHNTFLEFICHATYVDGGQTAALDYMGVSLGDVVSEFLGQGNWRPQRKAIAELLKEARPTEVLELHDWNALT